MVVLIGEWGFIVREHDNRVGFEVVVDLAHLDLVAFLGHTSVDAASRGDVHEHHRAVFPGHQVDGASAFGLPVALDDLVATLDEELLRCPDCLLLEFVHDGPPYVSAVRPFGLPPCEAKDARVLPAAQGRKAKEVLGRSFAPVFFEKFCPSWLFPRRGKVFGKHRRPLRCGRVPCGNARSRQVAKGCRLAKEVSVETERACWGIWFYPGRRALCRAYGREGGLTFSMENARWKSCC